MVSTNTDRTCRAFVDLDYKPSFTKEENYEELFKKYYECKIIEGKPNNSALFECKFNIFAKTNKNCLNFCLTSQPASICIRPLKCIMTRIQLCIMTRRRDDAINTTTRRTGRISVKHSLVADSLVATMTAPTSSCSYSRTYN